MSFWQFIDKHSHGINDTVHSVVFLVFLAFIFYLLFRD